MSGKPPKSEGPRDTDRVTENIAHGRTPIGCIRNTFLITLVAILWLVGNIYAQYLPLPWLAKATPLNPAVATLAPAQTRPAVATTVPFRTSTPISSPTPRR